MSIENKYCINPFNYNRLITNVVDIGGVPLGGSYPIRIQSMTNTNTLDTSSTVNQIISLYNAGSEYVRLTASSTKEAENLKIIKDKLKKKGISVPLVADIHFNPKAAIKAAQIVEKIRINPGNFHDRNTQIINYNKQEYNNELEIISKKLKPLINTCKNSGTAIRIGTNHGSLSNRVVAKYGNTPLGMVMSTIEYLKIFEDQGFKNTVISLKASNVIVMIEAYRLLASKLLISGNIYPLHLGVTEAGNDIEGRSKSAFGIGSLLADGIGDTIRVSLAEKPENEISVARKIIDEINDLAKIKFTQDKGLDYSPFDFKKRETITVQNIGADRNPIIVSKEIPIIDKDDFIYDEKKDIISHNGKELNFISIDSIEDIDYKKLCLLSNNILVINSENIYKARYLINYLIKQKIKLPIILKLNSNKENEIDLLIESSIKFGFLLCDGLVNGIWINNSIINSEKLYETSLNILQASRQRFSKAEFIICPTCGRTQYDIEKVSQEVKIKTAHLKGIKIAVMGCIVNGLGEMADADYGYIGTGNSTVNLYKGKILIKRNISENNAIDELISLIKENGDWIDKANN